MIHPSVDPAYKPYALDSGEYWTAILHENQYFLGRFYLWLHRPGKIDFMPGRMVKGSPYQTGLGETEHKELFKLTRQICELVNQAWGPDLWNYAWLANHVSHGHHGHLHVIPRYKEPRQFHDRVFTDGQWGKNYAPYPDLKYEPSVRAAIAEEIVRQSYN